MADLSPSNRDRGQGRNQPHRTQQSNEERNYQASQPQNRQQGQQPDFVRERNENREQKHTHQVTTQPAATNPFEEYNDSTAYDANNPESAHHRQERITGSIRNVELALSGTDDKNTQVAPNLG